MGYIVFLIVEVHSLARDGFEPSIFGYLNEFVYEPDGHSRLPYLASGYMRRIRL